MANILSIPDVQALLDPQRVKEIDIRAQRLGIGDLWDRAAQQAQAGQPNLPQPAQMMLAAIRAQQLVGLIHSHEDGTLFTAASTGAAVLPWAQRHPDAVVPENRTDGTDGTDRAAGPPAVNAAPVVAAPENTAAPEPAPADASDTTSTKKASK